MGQGATAFYHLQKHGKERRKRTGKKKRRKRKRRRGSEGERRKEEGGVGIYLIHIISPELPGGPIPVSASL
ncbi:hypothetical protein HOLleu_09839 [Holothuria leucospilota]|uniref:Uncharacterized protein n=1 Tax=Holothuria leucospilota TaxID=206669 RepID=A0A9Q1HF99_HOLLE|nr:hypothetical protein HOLleu_09839 [Holothuria leucospilota]